MTLLQPKVVLAVTSVIVALILVSLGQEVNRRWQTARQIQQLQQEVHQSQKEVVELENLNQYFSTADYQERLAREKLNYQAPGEHVIAIPDTPSTPTPSAATPTASKNSIALTWWKRFFVEQKPNL